MAKVTGTTGQGGGIPESISGMSIFAEELKAHRAKHGWTQVELGDKLGYSNSFVSDVERGAKVPSSDFAGRCDEAFEIPGTFVRLLEIAKLTIYPDYFAPVIQYEEKAVRIGGSENANIPGLLQTEEYAREQIRVTRHTASDEEVERLVAGRMERQNILTQDNPPMLWYVIDESPLRRTVGSVEVMARQMDRLVEVAATPTNIIQVITLEKGGGVGSAGPITIFELQGGEPPMVGYLEANQGGRVITDQREARDRLDDLNVIRASALSPRESLMLLQKIRGEYHEHMA